jgi:hypothetical protein
MAKRSHSGGMEERGRPWALRKQVRGGSSGAGVAAGCPLWRMAEGKGRGRSGWCGILGGGGAEKRRVVGGDHARDWGRSGKTTRDWCRRCTAGGGGRRRAVNRGVDGGEEDGGGAEMGSAVQWIGWEGGRCGIRCGAEDGGTRGRHGAKCRHGRTQADARGTG